MLLDCAKLTHWRCEQQFNELFEGKRDYMDWILLRDEPAGSIGIFEHEWNDFDRLTPADQAAPQHQAPDPAVEDRPAGRLHPGVEEVRAAAPRRPGSSRSRRRPTPPNYTPHPDPDQERFFFGLLRECLDKGVVSEAQLRDEMRHNHIRHDALELARRTPPLAA